jgi:hypothetical protein
MSTYLVVADRNAWSLGLARNLQLIGGHDHEAAFVVIVPADPAVHVDEAEAMLTAREAAARARTSLRLQGLTVLEASAGPASPGRALEEEMRRGSRSYDGIVVGTSRRRAAQPIGLEQVRQLEHKHGIPVRLIILPIAAMPHARTG